MMCKVSLSFYFASPLRIHKIYTHWSSITMIEELHVLMAHKLVYIITSAVKLTKTNSLFTSTVEDTVELALSLIQSNLAINAALALWGLLPISPLLAASTARGFSPHLNPIIHYSTTGPKYTQSTVMAANIKALYSLPSPTKIVHSTSVVQITPYNTSTILTKLSTSTQNLPL